MILIITNKDDYTADFVIDKLNNTGESYFRLNCEDFNLLNYTFNSQIDSVIQISSIPEFDSVWYRRTKLPSITDSDLSPSEIVNLTYEYDALLNNFLQTVRTKKWLSDPNNIRIAENKILQLNIAKSLGFHIPETIVTNNKQELIEFVNLYVDVIIKPLKNGRIRDINGERLIYTNRLKEIHIVNLGEYDLTPCIYQREIKKEYELRITVVGQSVFAAKVDSQSDNETQFDWRRKQLKFEPYKLDSELENKCRKIVSELGIAFGAIDIIKSIDGNYYFLEINPNGQWAWIEVDTGYNISDSIIKFLLND